MVTFCETMGICCCIHLKKKGGIVNNTVLTLMRYMHEELLYFA